MRNFDELSEREVLALAIANEEEDGRIYLDFSEGLRDTYPASAKVFTEMAAEEGDHRRMLLDLYRVKFGEHVVINRVVIRKADRCSNRDHAHVGNEHQITLIDHCSFHGVGFFRSTQPDHCVFCWFAVGKQNLAAYVSSMSP